MQLVYGGTSSKKDIASFNGRVPRLLVATPGRLVDHLRNVESGFRQAISGLEVLILDEADRLLDMGFSEDINAIFDFLPPTPVRQTLLFSATLPSNVQDVARRALKSTYELIDCVGTGDNTHDHVPQSVLIKPIGDQLAALACLLAKCMQVKDYKILVFFPTARQTQLYAEAFSKMGPPVLEIHSRKSQSARSNVSDAFRKGIGLTMFTSDVTARGMDYPDVTSVVQVGLPANREQYIHRVGRTGRAGKGGSAILLMTEYEANGFLWQVEDLGIKKVDRMDDEMIKAMKPVSSTAMGRVFYNTRAMAYQAWLGFNISNLRVLGWSKDELAEQGEVWCKEFAELDETPEMHPVIVRKMGLTGIPGIRILSNPLPIRGRGRGGARGRVRGRARGTARGREQGGRGRGRGRGERGGGAGADGDAEEYGNGEGHDVLQGVRDGFGDDADDDADWDEGDEDFGQIGGATK